jgi:UDP-GlcNAc:undecaprenyl-phosphate GlcNAc-1-phosphate transferase
MIYLSTLLLSMFLTIVLIPILTGLARKVKAIDIPDERKIHQHPMPRAGGAAMALGALIPILLWVPQSSFSRAILIGAGIVTVFGITDDIRNLGYKTKFAGQLVAALVVVFYGGVEIRDLGMLVPDYALLPHWVAIPLTVLVIVGVTNAINLSDGLDGLAGGISLLTFACIGYLAYLNGQMLITLLSIAAVGAVFGFLRYNTYPASVFMGDAGSQLIGFLAITLSLKLTQGHTPLSPLLPLIFLGFPVLDTMTVMLERLAEKKSPFAPDKNHLHHKLIRLGFFHTEAVLTIYILQAFLVTSAFVFRLHSEWFLLGLYAAFSGIILVFFFVTDHTGWRLRRYDLVDKALKGKLRVLKEKSILIRLSFKTLEICVPALLLASCLLVEKVPRHFSFFSLGFIGMLMLVWVIRKQWMEIALRVTLYLTIPFAVYMSESTGVALMNGNLAKLYHLSFAALALFVVLTLKFTRRTEGFKSTPMDFLILFIALVVPNLPDQQIQSYQLGLVAAKIIALFFAFEVLIGELRGELRGVEIPTIVTLLIASMKGFIG